ncbi:MAG: hypothetical protein JJU15_13115 [Pararhodobacter sp.]|nr:hypothetical protein [Pararhodobacter sp.]
MKTVAMKTLALALTFAAATTVGGFALAPSPAQASGNALVFEVNPTTRAEARAVRRGLAQLSGQNGTGGGAHVRQNGSNNGAAISQNGRGSTAVVQQYGNGHTGTVTQRGNNHAYGVFQFGENTTHHETQQGQGQTGMTVIIGW